MRKTAAEEPSTGRIAMRAARSSRRVSAEVRALAGKPPGRRPSPQAARPGFEPGSKAPKACVLPLHHRAKGDGTGRAGDQAKRSPSRSASSGPR